MLLRAAPRQGQQPYLRRNSRILFPRSLPKEEKSRNLSFRIGGSWTRTNGAVRRGIYSPLQLPLCDTPKRMLTAGLEPTTVRLQIGSSTS